LSEGATADFKTPRLQETSITETSKDFKRLHEASRDFK
jgi:hypothetical protein